jgi:hypothetical protein
MKSRYVLRAVCVAMFPLLTQCKDNSQVEMEIMQDETKCITLTQKLRLLDMQSPQADAISDGDIHASDKAGQQARLKLVDLRSTRDSLQADIHTLEGTFAKIEKAVVSQKWNSAIGRKFAVFETNQRTYKEITIQSVSETGLEIKHSSGSARITPMQLSAAQLDQFGLSVENAREIIAAEQRNQQTYIAQMDRVQLKQNELELIRLRKEEEQRKAVRKTEATVAAYVSPLGRSSLSDTPPTKVYRVRSSQPRFYNVWYPYSTGGSCGNHSSSSYYNRPEPQRIEPIYPQPR